MQFISALEKEAQRRLQPFFLRLRCVPRHEVRSLSRRIRQLERSVRVRRPTHTPSPPAAAAPAGALDSRQHAELFWDEV